MLNLIDSPGTITFSKNPIVYRFRATDAIGNAYGPKGQIANLQISSASFLVGDILTINWTDEEGVSNNISFNCVASPDGIGDLPAAPVTLADYQAIAAKIKAHYRISPFFSVTAIESSPSFFTITIKSIDPNPIWIISIDDTNLSGTTTVGTEDAIPDNTPDNLEVFMEVFFEQEYLSGTYERVATLGAIPDSSGEVSFDIHSILDKEVMNALAVQPLPSFDNNVTVKADNLRRYYIRFRLYFDDIEAVDTTWNHLGTAYLLCGGVSQSLFATTNYLANIDNTNSLLTWYPEGKIISPAQPEYLPWYNYTDTDKTLLVRLVQYTASSASTLPVLYKLANGITIGQYETANIPVGYTALGIDNNEVIKYTVSIVDEASDWDSGNPEYLSPEYTFYVDHNYYDTEKYLMYMNSFCCPVCIRCLGQFMEEQSLERTEANRILTNDYSTQTEEVFQYDVQVQKRFTYRTGHLRQSEIEALQELTIYNRLFEVTLSVYIPLYITSDEFLINQSRQNLFALTIETKPKLTPKLYSGAVETMGTYWETTFGEPWQTTFGENWQLT